MSPSHRPKLACDESSTGELDTMKITPFTLTGTYARLEPLGLKHANDLVAAAQFPDIWEYFLTPPSTTREQVRDWIGRAQSQIESGTQICVFHEPRTLDFEPFSRRLSAEWIEWQAVKARLEILLEGKNQKDELRRQN